MKSENNIRLCIKILIKLIFENNKKKYIYIKNQTFRQRVFNFSNFLLF